MGSAVGGSVSVKQVQVSPGLRRAGRRLGYGIAVVVNVIMLILVRNILDLGWLGFLTDEFEQVVPWISLSLVVSIVVNLIYQFDDTPVVKSGGQIGSNMISFLVTYRILTVFPFDFSTYAFDWEFVARVVLVLAMVGAGIGMLVETYKLVSHEPERERRWRMQTSSASVQEEVQKEPQESRRLYRSNEQRVVAGVCGGLGEYFALDPVWFRIGFVVLALGGGSGVLIYLLMWLVVQPSPDGYDAQPVARGSVTGSAVIGVVFIAVGTIALVNTMAPWMGQYFWPVIFVLGGLALVIGGLDRDTD
jgi:phage shock protein PspC (stress-responsive transcriptional regulator)